MERLPPVVRGVNKSTVVYQRLLVFSCCRTVDCFRLDLSIAFDMVSTFGIVLSAISLIHDLNIS